MENTRKGYHTPCLVSRVAVDHICSVIKAMWISILKRSLSNFLRAKKIIDYIANFPSAVP